MFNRRLTLADVARYTDTKSLINRTVFDLDSAASTEDIEGEILGEAVTQHQQPQEINVTLTGHEVTVASQCGPTRVQYSSPLPTSVITCGSSLATHTDVTKCHGSCSPRIESPSVVGRFKGTTARTNSRGGEEIPHLRIDSRFESGNLRKAIQVSYQYTWDNHTVTTLQLHIVTGKEGGGKVLCY